MIAPQSLVLEERISLFPSVLITPAIATVRVVCHVSGRLVPAGEDEAA